MAEARNISSANDLYHALDDSGLFARVEQTASGSVTVCYDAAGNAVLRTSGYSDIAVYSDASHSFPGTALGTITQAYLCEGGMILIKYYDSSLRHIFVLSKTNTGEPALVDFEVREDSWCAVTWGDVTPFTWKTMPAVTANQYALLPFVTNAPVGVSSYLPDAFYAAITPGSQLPRSFLMQGTRWFAVGNIVLRDGTA